MKRLPLTTLTLTVLLTTGAALSAADDHAGHDHGAHAQGAAAALGSVTLGAHTVAVASGAVTPGAELHVDLTVTPVQPAPQAIRVWVGAENGRGSVKAKAEGTAGAYEAHVEVPATLPAGAQLWISIDAAGGAATRAALALPATAAAHSEGDGHKH